MLRTVSLATLLAATLFTTAGFAQSSGAPAGKQVTVSYADLDLSRPAGAQVLMARLKAAATQACSPAPDARDLAMYRYYRGCIADTLERSIASVNAPLVTELYRGAPTVVASTAK